MKNAHLGCLISLVVSSVLVSCSSDDDNSSSVSNVSRLGVVVITDPLMGESIDITGFFIEQTDEVDPVVREDTCEVSFVNDDNIVEPASGSSLNAGEVLTLSSPAGTFADIQSMTFGETQLYVGPENLSAPVPSGLVLDIPGAEFPSFSDISVPNVEPFVLTSGLVGSFEDRISVASEITWEPGTDPEARIRFYYIATEVESSLAGVEEVREIDLDCVLLDDGSFTLDTAMQAQITDAGFDTIGVNIGRSVSRTVQQDDAMLIITNRSGDL